MSKNKGHFVVFQHVYRPAPGANTSMKNFGEEGQWQVQEYVYFVDIFIQSLWLLKSPIYQQPHCVLFVAPPGVFQWPGMGFLFIQAVKFVDIPIMSAYLVFIAFVFVMINFIVDILYYFIDPRIRNKEEASSG